ncbi:MAG: DUF1328 domain-containing protein [Anaerolineae bacterium]|nr:DUF1328 domain-containing protein [Anaerolineae bacterium]
MIKLIFVLLVVGLIAGLLGFAGLSHLAFSGAQLLALVLVALVVLGIVAVVTVGRRLFGS